MLLAIDAGLRCGLAWYGPDGRLLRYRSTHFTHRGSLRRAAYGLLHGASLIYVEGGGPVADPWLKAAEKRGLPHRAVGAEAWRHALLLDREQRSGSAAKANAGLKALQIIEWSGAPRPTGALRHDAAEAIVFGLWAVLEEGWLAASPI